MQYGGMQMDSCPISCHQRIVLLQEAVQAHLAECVANSLHQHQRPISHKHDRSFE